MTQTAETNVDPALEWHDGIAYFRLSDDERLAARSLAEDLVRDLGVSLPTELEEHLDAVPVYAHQMPERLRSVLNRFRLSGRPVGGIVLAGLPVEEAQLEATPSKYDAVVDGAEVTVATAVLLLVGSLLGDPFSFFSQQKGRLVLDVFPIAGHEEEQLGSSSTTTLEFHNEDAFHPHRADWIMLLCLRNPDLVPTMFASAEDLDLAEPDRRLLFEDRFVILPDESHTAAFNSGTTGMHASERQREAFERITRMNSEPKRTSIFSGDPDHPYVRIDPAFMQHDLDDAEAERAQQEAIRAFEDRMVDVALRSGELLVVDNRRAVHGRRPFQARYDGTDRWLRRINLTADLRSSAGRRFGSHGRALV